MENRTVAVLYGSETGNAHDYAETLTALLERYHFPVRCCALDDFDLKELVSIRILIVLCSTTGQGEFPKNARKFWKFMLKKKLPHDLLNHLVFTTFGLGDSSYPKFNWAARKLHSRLAQLGGVEFSKRAESDEQSPQGIDGYYNEFQRLLLDNLLKEFPLPEGVEPISEDIQPPVKNKVIIDTRKPKRLTADKSKDIALVREHTQSDPDNIIIASVTDNTRITAEDHFQDVRHLQLSVDPSTTPLTYSPGDTIALYPTNDPREVDLLIEMQGWTEFADRRVVIDGPLPSIEGGLVKTLTLRSLFTHHLDLKAIPRRSFFALLRHFASDEREKEKLAEFASFKDPEELYNYANRPRRSILEVIQEFFSVKIPLEYVLDLFPIIKPRLFSIASAPSPDKVELTVAIVQYRTAIRRIRRGLCTTWVKTLNVGDKVVMNVKRSNLRLPSPERPIIMVAPGTGIAPMRSVIHDRIQQFGSTRDQMVLFAGFRFHNKDFLYGSEWTTLAEQGKLALFTAFSREAGGYVQDSLFLEANYVAELLTHKDATVYVCGSSGKMPTQVRLTFESILQEARGLTPEQSKQYLLELEQSGRYIQETW
ncbi:NADPH-dependent diflavin oxidoreductase 1 [Cyberlindnera fabianii]|uniref:NADPH-dependent diflavin oxidoreductase 1 n=1 Tax=Cyberlindnera fabianii TaxID=36022 RepID=A0A1V2LCN5_CYBFA|nr:NADPH-dependent diflavin oxidoreductase 1 [Cyberlindnera fabianii]